MFRKAPVNYVTPVRLSIRLSVCISAARTRIISVKFGIEEFYKNLPRKKKTPGHFMHRPKYFLFLPKKNRQKGP
jgi:hypothetical protein